MMSFIEQAQLDREARNAKVKKHSLDEAGREVKINGGKTKGVTTGVYDPIGPTVGVHPHGVDLPIDCDPLQVDVDCVK